MFRTIAVFLLLILSVLSLGNRVAANGGGTIAYIRNGMRSDQCGATTDRASVIDLACAH